MRDIKALEAAFAQLKVQGVHGFHNFWCCHNCASYNAAVKHQDGELKDAIGVVFYHEQTVQRALAGGGLMLYYQGFPFVGEVTQRVGNMVMAALHTWGLEANWDGDPSVAIEIPKFELDPDEVPAYHDGHDEESKA
jgi:hypothetical protein